MSTNRVINAKDCAIRLARTDDLPLLRGIFAAARAFMAEHGNATQWGANFPPDELLLAHISRKELYVLESADGKPHAAFALTGEDPTYAHIKNGTWLFFCPLSDDSPRGERRNGARRVCGDCEICGKRCPHLRADTHENNAAMRAALIKNGFSERGEIRLADGAARLAYEKNGDE